MFKKKIHFVNFIIIILIIQITIILFFNAMYIYKTEYNKLLLKLQKKTNFISEQLSLGLKLPLWNYDNEQVIKIIETFMKDDDIYAIIIKYTDNSTIQFVRNEKWESINSSEKILNKDLIFSEKTIDYNNQIIGNLKIYTTNKFLREELKYFLKSVIFTTILLGVILIVSLSLILWFIILVPLKEVQNFAEKVISGSKDKLIEGKINFIDEISNLKASIKKMVELLNLRFLELKDSESKLKKILNEKEVLMMEIQHRLKNNLNVILSLLKYQELGIDDSNVKTKFKNIENRIYSIALIHNLLYKSKSIASINFKEYVTELLKKISASYDYDFSCFKINYNINEYIFGIDTIKTLGLIINELATNSIKYAFSSNSLTNEFEISFNNLDDEYIVKISDNGKGFSESYNLNNKNTSGLYLVNILCEEINANLSINKEESIIIIKFKL